MRKTKPRNHENKGEKGVLSCRKQSLWKKKWTKGSEKPPQNVHNLLSHRILYINCDRCDSKNHKTLVLTYARAREIQRKSHLSFCNSSHYPQKVGFHPSFSRHGITPASSVLLIWLNENGCTKSNRQTFAQIYMASFRRKVASFQKNIRLSPKNIGLFSKNIGLFSKNIGLFPENVAPFQKKVAYFLKKVPYLPKK